MGFNGIIAASRLTGVPDIIAPTIGTLSSVTRNSTTTATLIWTAASDNVAVTGYKIYRSSGATDDGFTLLNTVGNVLTTTDTTITDPTFTYYYYVTAVDARLNESSASNHVAVGAQSVTDLFPSGTAASDNTTEGTSNVAIFTSGRFTTITSDSTDKQVGTYSVKFNSSTTNIQQYRDSFHAVTSGNLYTFRFWAKASETGKCRINSTGGLVFSININATTWTEYSIVVTAASTSNARIYWYTAIGTSNGTEQMWVDDVRLYEDV